MPKANGHYQEFNLCEEKTVAPPYAAELQQVIETDSALLPDGRILDLILANTSAPRPELLVWRNGEFIQGKQVECDGADYVPPRLPKGLETAAHLPTAIGPLVQARELVADIEARVLTFFTIAESDAFLIALFALCSLFFDCLGFAPYLTVCGPPGSGKSTLLRFLR